MDSGLPRICVSICERTVEALTAAFAKAALHADLVELRLDCLQNLAIDAVFDQVNQLALDPSIPVIVTLRPVELGGGSDRSVEARLAFWKDQGLKGPWFCDLEVDLVEQLAKEPALSSLDWHRVICSYHDFSTPNAPLAELDETYERLAATPARILKIAVQSGDAVDCVPIFNLLERGRREGREVIAIAMGTPGIATRILGPSRGAFLTYATLENETATGPGQITASELRGSYQTERITRQTKIFGVVGSPISHSVSPQMHNAAFALGEVNAVYLPFEVHDLGSFIRRMIHPRTRELDWDIGGLSITAPHKQRVMEHLDWIDPMAQQIGAVNTIRVVDDALHGYNTDVIGFLKPLRQKFGPLPGSRCAVLGTGGAACAAIWALIEEAAEVTVFARNIRKGEELTEKFDVPWERLENTRFLGFDIVINATSLGSAGPFQNETPASAQQLLGARLAYDLVYNPGETRFLREAREAGCETLGGLPMLVAQAAEQYRLWTGQVAPEDVMYAAAERAL